MKKKNFAIFWIVLIISVISLGLVGCTAETTATQVTADVAAEMPVEDNGLTPKVKQEWLVQEQMWMAQD